MKSWVYKNVVVTVFCNSCTFEFVWSDDIFSILVSFVKVLAALNKNCQAGLKRYALSYLKQGSTLLDAFDASPWGAFSDSFDANYFGVKILFNGDKIAKGQ